MQYIYIYNCINNTYLGTSGKTEHQRLVLFQRASSPDSFHMICVLPEVVVEIAHLGRPV